MLGYGGEMTPRQRAAEQPEQQESAEPVQVERVEMTAEPRTPVEVSPGVTVTLLRDHPTVIVVERPVVESSPEA